MILIIACYAMIRSLPVVAFLPVVVIKVASIMRNTARVIRGPIQEAAKYIQRKNVWIANTHGIRYHFIIPSVGVTFRVPRASKIITNLLTFYVKNRTVGLGVKVVLLLVF